MRIEYTFAFILILLSVGSFVAVRKGWINSKTIEYLANIITIVSAIFSIFLILFPLLSQSPSGDPRINVVNNLELPVTVTIEGESRGRINAHQEKTYFINSFPATVEWSAIPPKTSLGTNMGERFAGTINNVNNNATINIDNLIKDQMYFFPQITNKTDVSCRVSFDSGLAVINQSKITINAHTVVDLGYYKLNKDSTIYFHCEGSDLPIVIKWQANPNILRIFGDLEGEIESPSGILHLVIDD